ncbi:MAG: DUF1273 family protein [Clostridia bacterium]|nr:DUF1273 family protein [Clostridia bacterium]
MKCALTGHRTLRGFKEEVMKREIDRLIEQGADTFYCGMAVGFDLTVCEYLIGKAKVIACIPYPDQAERYSEEDREKYRSLLEKCYGKVVMCYAYQDDCYKLRNYYMVDECDEVYAFFNGNRRSGTYQTVNYAMKRGKKVIYHDALGIDETGKH